jgi:hypothetical protein
MPAQNHLEKFSSAVVVKIHFGDDGEGVDQSTEIKFCMFINKSVTILAHCFRLYTVRFQSYCLNYTFTFPHF